jgi:glycosyltransferase involved in cell wall biosynthesis
MKKIAILAHSLGGGGIEKVVINLSKGFIAQDCEVHIFLLKNTIKYELPNGLHIHLIKSKNILNKISQIRPYFIANEINKLLHTLDINLLVSNFTDFYGIKIIDLIAFENTITIVHNTQSKRRFKRHKRGNTLLKRYKTYKIRKSFENKKLACVSKGVEKDLVENFLVDSKNVRTIYNPFDIAEIRELANCTNAHIPNEKYILHVGRFELGHKRQDLLLKAFAQANISHKLVLLGDGADRDKIEQLIKELNLQERVILPGFDKNPYPWMKHAELFVFSSDYEGFGLVLAESLIVGTPVVSTNCESGPSEILTGSLADFLVPVGDVRQLSKKIEDALKSYPAITDAIVEKFSIENSISQYMKYLK